MTSQPKVPAGMYGPGHDGSADPDRFTPAERMTRSPERLAEEHQRRQSVSPVVRKLQAATDLALGRAK